MFDEVLHKLGRFFREHRAGIYATISLHLLVMIVFLLYNIHTVTEAVSSFVFDFSKQEEKAAREQKEERRKTFEKELDKITATASRRDAPRNVAVDKSQQALKDDRHTNPSSIYDEARKVQERLDASRRAVQQQQGGDVVPVGAAATAAAKTENYKGPSVLSYDLGGRKAMRMPVPVYQCEGGGDVTVLIEVDRKGYVVNTQIKVSGSVDNQCLHDAAKRAARTTRFAASANAPQRQKGYIVYRFIKQ